MTDYQVLHEAVTSVNAPIEKPESLAANKELFDEYAHSPYVKNQVLSEVLPPADSVEVTESLTLEIAETGKIEVTIAPNNCRSKAVFSVDSEEVATVAQDGTVTAVAEGVATVTVTVDGESETCTVTVTAPVEENEQL